MQMVAPIVNPFVLVGGAIILVIVIIFFGYRSKSSGRHYWIVSTIKISIVYIIWQILSFIGWIVIITYTGGSIEQRFFNINLVNALTYFGLTLLLVWSEIRRSPRISFIEAVRMIRTAFPPIKASLNVCLITIIVVGSIFIINNRVIQFEYADVGPDYVWEDQSLDLGLDWSYGWLNDVAFYNATHGWAVGRPGSVEDVMSIVSTGVVIRTTDGGTSWELVLDTDEELFNIALLNETDIWVAGMDGLFYSYNGGWSWELLNETPERVRSVAFWDSMNGLASTNDGLLFTTDGGDHWYPVESWEHEVPSPMDQIRYASESDVWACGAIGLFHSSDGGQNWVQIHDRWSYAVFPVSESDIWALKNFGSHIIHSTDGSTWSNEFTIYSYIRSSSAEYRDIEFVDSENGWIVGTRDASIMYTPDGGDSWFLQDDTHIMNAVDFINETHGWAVGWGGVIQRTTKGNSLGSKMSKDGVDISFNTSVLRVPPIVFFIDAFIIGVYPVCLIFRRVWKIRLTRR